MPEFWELCNGKSKAVLIQLYWAEHNCLPDWFTSLDKVKPVRYEPYEDEEHWAIVNREMSRPPSNRRDGVDE